MEIGPRVERQIDAREKEIQNESTKHDSARAKVQRSLEDARANMKAENTRLKLDLEIEEKIKQEFRSLVDMLRNENVSSESPAQTKKAMADALGAIKEAKAQVLEQIHACARE